MRGTLCLLVAAILGCAGAAGPAPAGVGAPRVHVLPATPGPERECAWYGDAQGETLYYGIAAFWSAMRAAGGDPRADLAHGAPPRIGRFDTRRRRVREPLALGASDAATGVWDVLAHPDGAVYFTSFFGLAGRVEPSTGVVVWFEEAGPGFSELALGADDTLLATRYAGPRGGSVVVLDRQGRVLAEHALPAPPGYRVAAKSVAWDPLRDEIWVNTDLLPLEAGVPSAHDVRVLGPDGAERLRFARPDVQFMAFGPDGTGYFAEVDGPRLTLRVRRPEHAGRALLTGTLVPLDDAFDPDHDFVQDLKPLAGGAGVVVTRWSGRIHRVGPRGGVRSATLPRGEGALYYTAVAGAGGVCATRCDAIEVVCGDWETGDWETRDAGTGG